MKIKFLPLVTLISFSVATAAATQPVSDERPSPVSEWISPSTDTHSGVTDTVYEMLTDAGRTAGFRGGKAERAFELKSALLDQSVKLDALFKFSPLINRQGWLPPVISEAKSLATVTDQQIRTASHVYTIVVPERFVSNPPDWKKYLFAGLSLKATPEKNVIPRTRTERAVWDRAIRAGWEDGRKSADETLEANFSRLTRDYTGMLRYSILIRQNMVLPPAISEQHLSVTGNSTELLLGDRVRTLQKNSTFNLDKKSWHPIIRQGKKWNQKN